VKQENLTAFLMH